MVEWSIAAFRACEAIGAIVVAVPAEKVEEIGTWAEERDRRGAAEGTELIAVPGGATRAESVAIALAAIEKLTGTETSAAIETLTGTETSAATGALTGTDAAVVAIHDAARPLLTPQLVEALLADLAAAPEAAGVIAATAVTDTIKRAAPASEEGRSPTRRTAFSSHVSGNAVLVETTEDRSRLWAAQTPQVFRLDALREALAAASNPDAATDEAMLVEAVGGTVLIHPCGPENVKVTTKLDLRVAELLLADRGKQP
jgi:2-C-methyl-D-erythritol 4-phosphate cytidylyltransferase